MEIEVEGSIVFNNLLSEISHSLREPSAELDSRLVLVLVFETVGVAGDGMSRIFVMNEVWPFSSFRREPDLRPCILIVQS